MSKTSQVLKLLRDHESRNVTFVDPDGNWPIVWERAQGVHVWDAEGRKYLDLTAAFGVANAGHANPAVVRAGRRQMAHLLHAMGDVHPHALKAELARELSRLTFERWHRRDELRESQTANATRGTRAIRPSGKTIFCNSGFEAVEAALKTALLATGRPGVIAFEGAYHGLGHGALNTTHRAHFRAPFHQQLARFGHFVPFPTISEGRTPRVQERLSAGWSKDSHSSSLQATEAAVTSILRRRRIGAILVEPVQGRGGIRIPPRGFLKLLRRLCDEHGAMLILDEIFTGFGRTGKWFACEHEPVIPDVICLGKALTGGFPLSACVGRADLMDAAWPPSTGEAIHTSTFLGHPVGCAMALAQIRELERLKLIERSRKLGEALRAMLSKFKVQSSRFKVSVRGLGLMAGLELLHPDGSPATEAALHAIKEMLRRGFILLPEGGHGNVIALTPPLTISEAALRAALKELEVVLRGLAG
jgi:4-aminobutyrate aminotransferase-like enzyme